MQERKKIIIPKLNIEDIFESRIYHNTDYFREAAHTFLRYGRYCLASTRSTEWYNYWQQETDRCLYGMESGGLYITGKHYFYLNYCPIKAVPDAMYLSINKKASPNAKVNTFPKFWELDYQWWLTKELCRQRAENNELHCHLVCLKTRRAGYSFKEAAEGVYNYTFFKGSKSIYYAGTDQYLTEGGIFNKVDDILTHVNKHTYWKQNFIRNDRWYKISGYMDAKRKKFGNKSELQAVVLNDPDKARGDDAIKVTFEEFGSFVNGLKAWEICLPQVRAGLRTVGFMTGFGTGGDVKGAAKTKDGMEAIEEIFYKPEAYLAVAFPNIWDEGLEGTTCGFFVPAYMTYDDFADEHGNLNKKLAHKAVLDEREIRAKGKNIDANKAESPIQPREALYRKGVSEFPTVLLTKQKHFINTTNLLANMVKVGKFAIRNKKLTFVESEIPPYNDYPIPLDGEEKPSVTVIWQDRHLLNDSVPGEIGDLYIALLDPVMKDDAKTSRSIFSCYIYKRNSSLDVRKGDRLVAALNGRFKTRDKYYKQLFALIEYYNAKLYCEAGGGGDAVLDYARNNGYENYLAYELTFDSRKELDVERNRSYFINMTTSRKNSAITYLSDWLVRTRSYSPDNPLAINGEILNVNLIFDTGLLTELIMYNDDDNFDRVSALLLLALVLEELEKQEKEQEERTRKSHKNNFFNRNIFKTERKNVLKSTYLNDI